MSSSNMKWGYLRESCQMAEKEKDIAVLRYAMEQGGAKAGYYLGCLYYDRFRYEEAAQVWEEGLRRDASQGKIWRNLALYWFDKAAEPEKAKMCMEKALEHKGDDPRLLLEYQQLLSMTLFLWANQVNLLLRMAISFLSIHHGKALSVGITTATAIHGGTSQLWKLILQMPKLFY